MTVAAFYVGGPRDGQMVVEPQAFETKIVNVMSRESFMTWGRDDEQVSSDGGQYFIYRRMHTPNDSNCALVIYMPRDWSVEKVLERLIEYYRPERDET